MDALAAPTLFESDGETSPTTHTMTTKLIKPRIETAPAPAGATVEVQINGLGISSDDQETPYQIGELQQGWNRICYRFRFSDGTTTNWSDSLYGTYIINKYASGPFTWAYTTAWFYGPSYNTMVKLADNGNVVDAGTNLSVLGDSSWSGNLGAASDGTNAYVLKGGYRVTTYPIVEQGVMESASAAKVVLNDPNELLPQYGLTLSGLAYTGGLYYTHDSAGTTLYSVSTTGAYRPLSIPGLSAYKLVGDLAGGPGSLVYGISRPTGTETPRLVIINVSLKTVKSSSLKLSYDWSKTEISGMACVYTPSGYQIVLSIGSKLEYVGLSGSWIKTVNSGVGPIRSLGGDAIGASSTKPTYIALPATTSSFSTTPITPELLGSSQASLL